MLPEQEIRHAVEIARKYGVGRLYLIGSALHKKPEEVNDYDFAVQDVPAGNFFKFYGELLRAMPKDVDLVDLSGKMTKFKAIVMREGRLIYEKAAA